MLRVNAKLNSSEPAGSNSGQEKGRALEVVLACEDFAAGMHALCAFDRHFPANDSKQSPGAQSVWKFELLGITSLREVATAEAAALQMVIAIGPRSGRTPAHGKKLGGELDKGSKGQGGRPDAIA